MLCRNNKDRFDRFYRFFKKERENNYRTLREIILPAGPLCGDVSACGIVALRRPLRRFSHAVRMPQPPPLARCGSFILQGRPQPVCNSLDHLVGAAEQRRRHGQPKCLGGFKDPI
jgi:hypothetical protein